MEIVIAGADGFIGRHLIRHLIQQGGVIVYAICLPGRLPPEEQKLPGVYVLEGDLTDWRQFVPGLPQAPDAFFDLAWTGVGPECREVLEQQLENIQLSLNAVRLAHEIHAKRFILPGSILEYTDCGHEINAMSVPCPQNAYGAVKVSTRYLCAALCAQLKVPFIYCVISSIYAADRTDNNVVHYTITKLLCGECPQLTKLEQLWDYVHIDDVVNALYLIAVKGREGAFYTIGHGDNWPLANYIYIIHDMIDPRLPLGIGEIPYKNNRIPNGSVDLKPLCADTGYIPRISFEQGIRQVIENIRQRLQKQKGDVRI